MDTDTLCPPLWAQPLVQPSKHLPCFPRGTRGVLLPPHGEVHMEVRETPTRSRGGWGASGSCC